MKPKWLRLALLCVIRVVLVWLMVRFFNLVN